MRLSRLAPIVLTLAVLSALAMSCAPKTTTTATTQTVTATVQKGNVNVAITAVGNLALSQKEDLAFEIPGTIQEVSVNIGDAVKKGQVIATLDTTDWDKQVTTLERAVTTAQRAVTAKQNALRDAQIAVTNAQYAATSAQLAVTQAQLAYQSANDTLNQIADVKKIQDRIDDANDAIKLAKNMVSGQAGGGSNIDSSYWFQVQQNAQSAITQANIDMRNLLAGTSTTVTSDVALQVLNAENTLQQKNLAISQAQLNLLKANNTLSDAQSAVAPAQEDVQNAQDDLLTARNNLADAQSKSPQVVAPFDGFITGLNTANAAGGDVVQKGTVVATIADPTKFEADLLVNETDISKVQVGGNAVVALQAASGTNLSANITDIAPTATSSQGVVNYKVTVTIQSTTPLPVITTFPADSRQPSSNFTSGNFSGGQFPRNASGNFTPGRGPSGNFTPGQGNLIRQPVTTTSAANIKLADGMTVTVTIPVRAATSVLIIPNGAITSSAGESTVKVVKADGTIEVRPVQTGIADAQNTEITGGLTEGEKVQYTRAIGSSSSTNRGGGPVVIPGGGFIGR
jgi:multidrug efflux pump subunit AcrA (membrane-fusion protein)